MTALREALKDKLTDKEMRVLKTAFDTIGDIAILEIPDELKKKEKLIGNTLLNLQKNIKVVCKKSGIHSGVYRTQKLKVIAGEKRKETEYVENGVRLRLDAEKVYFSPRLSTERARINNLVKDDEEVLVMFSGCGPYVFNISKNAKAADVYGIEMNPIAHKYAVENKKLNKVHNGYLFCGDVREIVPNFYKYIVGLKAADLPIQLESRIAKHPSRIELHLFDDDLKGKRLRSLENKISLLKDKNIAVVVHMPFHVNGRYVNLAMADASEDIKMLEKLGELCKKHNIRAVVHPSARYSDMKEKFDYKTWICNLLKLKKYYDYFYFENIYDGPYSCFEDIEKSASRLGFKKICIDLAHAYRQYRSNKKIIEGIKRLKKKFNLYFHISDSNGETEGDVLGKGRMDFANILPMVNKGITEIRSKDENHPVEQFESYKRIGHMQKKFDRILMPLPKEAEDFLDVALLAAKKGTVIHFYDFLHEKEIPKVSIAKIEKACKKAKMKFKILNYVKCGQYSPRKFRVCIDFKIS